MGESIYLQLRGWQTAIEEGKLYFLKLQAMSVKKRWENTSGKTVEHGKTVTQTHTQRFKWKETEIPIAEQQQSRGIYCVL